MIRDEPGWILCSNHDPTGRRGVWMRRGANTLEICGGREGDDYYVRLAAGESVTGEQLAELDSILDTQRWMLEGS